MKTKISNILFLLFLLYPLLSEAQKFDLKKEKQGNMKVWLNPVERLQKNDFNSINYELKVFNNSKKFSGYYDMKFVYRNHINDYDLENSLVAALGELAEEQVNNLEQSTSDSKENQEKSPEIVTSPKNNVDDGWNENSQLKNKIIDPLSLIKITGFGDFYSKLGAKEDGEKNLQLGQVEVDLATTIGDKVNVEAAIAYDQANETFGLGAFTVDLPLFGTISEHFYSANSIDQSGIIIGQFDVPFGIDWEVYPSIDRKLISAPLIVENIHECWNDYGFQLYAENDWFETVFFAINGFDLCDHSNNSLNIEIPSTLAIGGRLAIKPKHFVELGSSITKFYLKNNVYKMNMWGIDAQFELFQLFFKGEFINRDIINTNGDVKNNGYYCETMYEFTDKFVVMRYGNYRSHYDAIEESSRVSIGLGWVILSGCELRGEHQVNSDSNSQSSYIQLVVGF